MAVTVSTAVLPTSSVANVLSAAGPAALHRIVAAWAAIVIVLAASQGTAAKCVDAALSTHAALLPDAELAPFAVVACRSFWAVERFLQHHLAHAADLLAGSVMLLAPSRQTLRFQAGPAAAAPSVAFAAQHQTSAHAPKSLLPALAGMQYGAAASAHQSCPRPVESVATGHPATLRHWAR
eukprot:598460-Amphidinium_carterae.1